MDTEMATTLIDKLGEKLGTASEHVGEVTAVMVAETARAGMAANAATKQTIGNTRKYQLIV